MDNFWLKKDGWPTDPPGWVFLARAATALGEAIYPDWPDGFTATALARSKNTALRSLLSPRPVVASGGRRLSPPKSEDLAKAQENLEHHLQRQGRVIAQLRTWGEVGALMTATRPGVGGDVRVIQPVAWSSQRLHNWFIVCQLNPNDPFSSAFAGEDFQHIFVKRSDLDRLLRSDGLSAGIVLPPVGIQESSEHREVPAQNRRGGKPLDTETWGNFVVTVASVFASQDLAGKEMDRAKLRKLIQGYADTVGLAIPGKGTIDPVLDNILRIAFAEHDEKGRPKFAADGTPLQLS